MYVANGAGSGSWALAAPIGSDTAASGSSYISDGAGGGSWRLHAQGSCYFENIAAPFVITALSTPYIKAAPTTTPSGTGVSMTEGTTARLTYTGTPTLSFNAFYSISLSTTVARDLRVAVFKNGVKIGGSVTITTTTGAIKQSTMGFADVSLATNDYIEIFIQNDGAATDVSVYTFSIMVEAMD